MKKRSHKKEVKDRIKSHIKKEDRVKVITGRDRGKIGKVLKVIRKDNRVLIENINIVKHHTKPNAKNKQGGATNACRPCESECSSWKMENRCGFAENAVRSLMPDVLMFDV